MVKVIRPDTKLYCKDTGRVKQAFKDSCDINKIMLKYKKVVGADYLATFNAGQGGQFIDCTNLPNLREALDTVNRAEEAFAELPAQLRKRFGHDPLEYVEFCMNPENSDELVKLGLATKKVAPNVTTAEIPK